MIKQDDHLDRLLLGGARGSLVLLLLVRPGLVDKLVRVVRVVVLIEALQLEVNILPNKTQRLDFQKQRNLNGFAKLK